MLRHALNRFPSPVWVRPAALLLVLCTTRLAAHLPAYGVGTQCRLVFKEDKVLLTFDLSYDGFWAQGEMLKADTDRSSSVDEKEADAYMEAQWKEKIAPRLRMRIDGKDVAPRRAAKRHEGLIGEIYGVPFSLYYELEVDYPAGKVPFGSLHDFEIEDTVVRDETPAKPAYFVPYQGHGSRDAIRFLPQFTEPAMQQLDPATMSYVLEGPRLRMKFSFESEPIGDGGARGGDMPAASGPVSSGAPPALSREAAGGTFGGLEGSMVSRLSSTTPLHPWEIALYVLFALIAGASHALAPGHGKSMVAAYLIGTKGRIRDAVVLGAATTVTHTGSVFLFGVAILLILNATAAYSAVALQNMVIIGTQMVSGALLLFLGTVLFVRRFARLRRRDAEAHSHSHGHGHGDGHEASLGAAHEHSHAHGHGHSHDHSQLAGLFHGGRPRLKELLLLGFSGGIVPCPAGLTVILLSLRVPDRLPLALFLLIFFSMGLGAVLVAIGVFLITGKALVGSRAREGAFFQEIGLLRRWLPAGFLRLLDATGLRALRVMPLVSSLLIAGLGAFFCVRTYMTGKTELVGILRGVADWIQAPSRA